MERLLESGHHVNGVMNAQQRTGGEVYDIINAFGDVPRRVVHGVCEGFDYIFGSTLPLGNSAPQETSNITNIPREIVHGVCEGFDYIFGSNLPIPRVTQAPYVPGEKPYTPSEF